MPRREELQLADIDDACRDVIDFLDGQTLDDWVESRVLQFAVLQRLTVIGEAARLAVHDYVAVEWPLVWAIARRDVPVLRHQVREILAADYPLVLASLDED